MKDESVIGNKISNPMMAEAACREYSIPESISGGLRSQVGSSLLKSLKAGFDAGKAGEPHIFEAKGLMLKFGIENDLDPETSDLINHSLYLAFQEGYRDGKSTTGLINKMGNSENADMRLMANIIDQCAKPENMLLINYLTK